MLLLLCFIPVSFFLEGVFFICFSCLSLISPQALIHLCQVPFNMLRLIGYVLEMSYFGIYQFGLFFRFVYAPLELVYPFTVTLCMSIS